MKLHDEVSFCRLSGTEPPAHGRLDVMRAGLEYHLLSLEGTVHSDSLKLAAKLIPQSSAHISPKDSIVFLKEPVNKGLTLGHAERK